MQNEEIELVFPESEKDVTWTQRTPHVIIQNIKKEKKHIKKQAPINTNKVEGNQEKTVKRKKINESFFRNLSGVDYYINSIKKNRYKYDTTDKKLKIKSNLEGLKIIVTENFKYYKNDVEANKRIRTIDKLINYFVPQKIVSPQKQANIKQNNENIKRNKIKTYLFSVKQELEQNSLNSDEVKDRLIKLRNALYSLTRDENAYSEDDITIVIEKIKNALTNNIHPRSKRMIEINTELQNIKNQIKSNNLTLEEINSIRNTLNTFLLEFNAEENPFYKTDNIPVKEKQISRYLNKLDELEESMKIKD